MASICAFIDWKGLFTLQYIMKLSILKEILLLCVYVLLLHKCASAAHVGITQVCKCPQRHWILGICGLPEMGARIWSQSLQSLHQLCITRTWIWSIGYIMDTFLSEVFLWICSGYVCPRVHVFVWVQVYVCLQAWRTVLSLWLQSAAAVHLVLWNRISQWLETWLVCLAVDSKIPSVSACPARNTEVCTTMPATFMLVLGIEHRESFMLARQASYCQSHTRDLGVSFPCWTIFCLAPMWLMVYWDPVYLLE